MQKWNNTMQFPADSDYMLRVIDATFAPSRSSGKPMLTLKYEIAGPEAKEIAGESFIVSGQQLASYHVITSIDEHGVVDAEKTAVCRSRFATLCGKFGLPTDDIDWDNINPELFKNKVVYAQLRNEQHERRKAPTADQIAKRQKVGDIMKNPITGKDLVTNAPTVVEIFGLVPGSEAV